MVELQSNIEFVKFVDLELVNSKWDCGLRLLWELWERANDFFFRSYESGSDSRIRERTERNA